jgi:hypothetical protein
MRVWLLPLLAALLSPGAACAPAASRSANEAADDSYLISAERIRRSGATNGWEALARSGAPVSMGETPNGEPRSLNRRGRNSIMLSSTPLLVVDDIRMADFHYLRRIPAETIVFIRILSGASGTLRYGTGGGNGVVVVQTRAR